MIIESKAKWEIRLSLNIGIHKFKDTRKKLGYK